MRISILSDVGEIVVEDITVDELKQLLDKKNFNDCDWDWPLPNCSWSSSANSEETEEQLEFENEVVESCGKCDCSKVCCKKEESD